MIRLPFWYPPILTYHCVLPSAGSNTPTVSVETFGKQMRMLRCNWNPISLGQAVDALARGQWPNRGVVVTFDDGTEDNFTHAFPVLSQEKIPATIFVITQSIGTAGFLTADQIRTMHESGIDFGSHSDNHDYLPSLEPEQARRSLENSKKSLEQVSRLPVQFVSYPAGGHTTEIMQAAREAGYSAACTTNRGFRRFPVDLFALRRVTIHEKVQDRFIMGLLCSGYSAINRRLRPPH